MQYYMMEGNITCTRNWTGTELNETATCQINEIFNLDKIIW